MNFIYIYFGYKDLYHLKCSNKPSHINKIHIYFSKDFKVPSNREVHL